MKAFELVPTQTLSAITCDCCKASFVVGDPGWYEIQSIEFVAGYESIFGDGNTVSIDLCQECLKQTLGPWLHIQIHRHVAAASALSESDIDTLRRRIENQTESNPTLER